MSLTNNKLEKFSNLTDIPLTEEQKDLLGVDRYVSALARFIQRARTPSTLSIQGEWGSGKTSLMNQLKSKLCISEKNQDKPYRGIWLNIWKLSLMNTPEQTLAQIIREITKEILGIVEQEYGGYDENKKDFWEKVEIKKFGKNTVKALIKGAINIGSSYLGAGPIIGSIINNTSNQDPQLQLRPITTIPELQNSMEAVINYCWEKDREKNINARGFLFFIDDLDRLDPAVAVSVLELLKNVFEVNHCVFVLAIDYEVVVRGLVPKFGEFNDKTERQFRSFFDKIIQLPFNMPVQSYDTKSYVTEALTNIDYFTTEELEQKTSVTEYDYDSFLDEDDLSGKPDDDNNEEVLSDDYFSVADTAVELIKLSTGSNPRSMIRLVNSLSLNQIMWEDPEDKEGDNLSLTPEEKLVNLGLTCIQISYGTIYTLLNNNPCFLKWDDNFAEQSRLTPLSDPEQKELEISNEKLPWQVVIRRAVQNNIYMRMRRRNIEMILRIITKLAVGSDVQSISSDVEKLAKLDEKFRELLSFSAVTEAGVSSIATEKKNVNENRSAHVAAVNMSFANTKDATGEIHIDPDSCTRRFVRFTTDAMNKILPDAPEAASGWGTRNHYFYEIVNSAGKSVNMQLALSAKNIPDDLKEICERINTHFPSKRQTENWQWRCPFITRHVSIPEDMADEDIIKVLSDQYAQLQEFEKKLVEAMNKEEQ